MLGNKGKIPTIPPVAWSCRCSQLLFRACNSAGASVSNWKRGVSAAITQRMVCCWLTATSRALRLVAMYLAALRPCMNGCAANFADFGSRPSMHLRRLSIRHWGHSCSKRSSQGRCGVVAHARGRVWQAAVPQRQDLVSKSHAPGCRVGNPWRKHQTSCDMEPWRACFKTRLSQGSTQRCSVVNSKSVWMPDSVRDHKSFWSPATSHEVPPAKGFWKMAVAFTGGNCQRSPVRMRLRPPNGRASPLPLFFQAPFVRVAWVTFFSSVAKTSRPTVEISSRV